MIVCFLHRKDPQRFCHVTPCIGGSTVSDIWTDDDVQRQEVSLAQLKEQLPSLTEEALAQYGEESLLFFWTHSAFFKVAYDETNQPATSFTEYTEQTRPIIEDEDKNRVGSVCRTATARGDHEPQEFVAIGQRQIIGVPESLAEENCPPILLALQIERDQDDICSRVNYAEIGLKAWIGAKPRRTLVALR